MAIRFREVSKRPLQQVTVEAPGSATIGIIGDSGSGAEELLRLAEGELTPEAGTVGREGRVVVAPRNWSALDGFVRLQQERNWEQQRRAGATILVGSHDLDWLLRIADELWWLQEGRLVAKGEPREVAAAYRAHLARRLQQADEESGAPALAPTFRRGDGRAEILDLQVRNGAGQQTTTIASGEMMQVVARVRYAEGVAKPVFGIMLRTRIGFEVFGTNTELEGLAYGPVEAGREVTLGFRFVCQLCPQEYTITAASHDPDGVAHDWMESAIAFRVTDTRYTAGVANLRARAELL